MICKETIQWQWQQRHWNVIIFINDMVASAIEKPKEACLHYAFAATIILELYHPYKIKADH